MNSWTLLQFWELHLYDKLWTWSWVQWKLQPVPQQLLPWPLFPPLHSLVLHHEWYQIHPWSKIKKSQHWLKNQDDRSQFRKLFIDVSGFSAKPVIKVSCILKSYAECTLYIALFIAASEFTRTCFLRFSTDPVSFFIFFGKKKVCMHKFITFWEKSKHMERERGERKREEEEETYQC